MLIHSVSYNLWRGYADTLVWDYLFVEAIPANTVGQRYLSLPHMA